jgi:beta-galactosidase
MRTKLSLVTAFFLLFSITQSAHSAQSPRQRILLDSDWRFHLAGVTPLLIAGNNINQWRWTQDSNGPTDTAAMAAPGLDTTGAAWKDTKTGTDVFGGQPGYAWYRTEVPNFYGPNRTLLLKVDDNADVYLNGQKLTHHQGWSSTFAVTLDSAWNAAGPNYLAILVQNMYGSGGVNYASYGVAGSTPNTIVGDPSAANFDDSDWRTVHLPHDFVVEGTFSTSADAGHGSLPTQPAWYRKTFVVPPTDKGKAIWIDFDGVYRDSVVYLNGSKLGEFQSGYAPFRYDISSSVRFGSPNVLSVSVDPTSQEGWWYEGGGIYRHVWLNIANPIHVAPFGTYVNPQLPEPVAGQPVPPATVNIQTTIDSPAGTIADVQLRSELVDAAGKSAGSDTTPVPLSSSAQVVTQQIVVPRPQLWSIEQPNLYLLKTTVLEGKKVVDTYTTPFGIRTIRFDANGGFFLNGKSVKIKGVCNHQDFAGIGIAVPDSLEYWRVRVLKAMGTNGWRTSHNPPTASVLNACDKLGMVVMDENRHLGDTTSPKTPPGTTFTDPSELDAMILRDRNHPSVIMWSMCNEEPLQGSPIGAALFKAMRDNVLTLDTTRPVTCAMSGGYDTLNGFSGVEDLQGINYNPGAYAAFHSQHPAIPVFGSETASTVSTRGVYTQETFKNSYGTFTGVEDLGWVSAYDQNRPPWAQTAHDSWAPQADQAFVAGGFAWTGFDYKGEPTPFDWPDINSNFGIVDECGFPKDGYYYYQSWWLDRPIVHVFPHWNWAGKEGQTIPVWVYSNAASVDLVVNGVSQGKQPMPTNGHVQWNVAYSPGTVVAIGYDASGNLIGSDKVETTGPPAGLRLIPDRTKIVADGEDIVPVEVDVIDAQGRLVADASTNRITFSITGPGIVAGVGNGNPSDHDPDKANTRLAFNGKALVDLGSIDQQPGTIKLTASADGLTSTTISVTAVSGTSSDW